MASKGNSAWFGVLVVIVALLFMLSDLGWKLVGSLSLWPVAILLLGIRLLINENKIC